MLSLRLTCAYSVTNALLPLVRAEVSGFEDIEDQLTDWLHMNYGTTVELFFAHGLRQGPRTLKSTGFDVHQVSSRCSLCAFALFSSLVPLPATKHPLLSLNPPLSLTASAANPIPQDTEDFDFIEYTVVVKLTPSEAGEPASQMRVVGAQGAFDYGPRAGDAGCFLSRLHHASVRPRAGVKEHLKMAFFFRKSDKGERRAKRGLGAEQLPQELAVRRKHVVGELNEFVHDAKYAVRTRR